MDFSWMFLIFISQADNEYHAFTSFVNLEKYINTYKYDSAGEFMNKTLTCLLLGIVMITVIPVTTAYTEDVDTTTHNIVITTEDEALSVQESLTIQGESNQTYSIIQFWVQSGAENVNILVDNNEITPIDDEYTYDISYLNKTMNSSIQVTIYYTLSKDIKNFEKTLIRNTSSISVKFDESNIYVGSNLQSGASFNILLYKPSETPLSWYVVVIIILLVILLAVSTLYSFKKQKSKAIDVGSESEELLNTRKTLLMSILKDIEKQHRSKQISDDTYHKLKEQYKQQTVKTMKKLEDIGSKIK